MEISRWIFKQIEGRVDWHSFPLGLPFGEHTEAQKGLHGNTEWRSKILNKVYMMSGLFTIKWFFKLQDKNEDFVTLF